MRCAIFLIAVGVTMAAGPPAEAASQPRSASVQSTSDVSAQTRKTRRARERITVRPLRGELRRECVPVFEERWIPQWGGRVLYAGQSCRWTNTPAPPDTSW